MGDKDKGGLPSRRTPGSPVPGPGWLPSTRSRVAPHPGDPSPPTLSSDVQRTVLDNGLRLLVKEVYPASVVSLAVWVGVGSVHEPDEAAGISHFVEHMLFKGTPTRPVGRLAQEIHELGGYLNGFTSYECTCYWVVCPSRHFDTVLDIAADAILNPLFDAEETRRESRVILDEMRMYQDRPDYYCMERLFRLAFPSHRYGRPVIGLEPVLEGMTGERLEEHHRCYYRANNMAVTVVGDVDGGHVRERVRRVLGEVAAGPGAAGRPAPEPPQEGLRRLDLEGDLSMAHLQMGFHLPSLFSEEAFACDLVSSILGDGRSSRLSRELRERRGLVNRIGCSAFLEKDPGLLIVEATLPPENLAAAEEAVFGEVGRLAREGLDRAELQKARNLAESSYVFSQETVEGQARKLGYYEMLGDHRLAEDYVRRLTAVTAGEVREAAARFLRPEACSVVFYRPSGAASA